MRPFVKIIILLLLPLTALEANAQDDYMMNIIHSDGSVVRVPINNVREVKIDKASNHPRPLTIKVSDQPLEDKAVAAGTRRKISPTTTEFLNDFYFHYVYDNSEYADQAFEASLNEDGEYVVDWPDGAGDDTPVTFYAYANVNVDPELEDVFFLDDSSNEPYIEFMSENDPLEQVDLLVAQCTDTWQNCGGSLDLTFSHACAALEFYICKTASLANYDVEVSNVKLCNIPSLGQYFFKSSNSDDSDRWEIVTSTDPSLDFKKDYNLPAFEEDEYLPVDDVENKDLLIGSGDYIFVIPQTLTPWDKKGKPTDSDGAYIEITCRISMKGNGHYIVPDEDDENEWGKVYIPFPATLKKGCIHPFTIQMGSALRDENGNKIFNY